MNREFEVIKLHLHKINYVRRVRKNMVSLFKIASAQKRENPRRIVSRTPIITLFELIKT